MMKSKVVRGIINGGVLAAVAALGITVYQLGTKPLTESKDDSVQMKETGLEEEISDEGDAEVSGSGSTEEADGSGIADGDSVKNAAVDADGWLAAVEQEMWLTEVAVLQELVRQLQMQMKVTVLRLPV